MAIFSRGDIAIGGGGADCALAEGALPEGTLPEGTLPEGTLPGGALVNGAPAEGGCAEAPPDTALTAVWQFGDNWLRLLCRHCNAALPPVGTPEQ